MGLCPDRPVGASRQVVGYRRVNQGEQRVDRSRRMEQTGLPIQAIIGTDFAVDQRGVRAIINFEFVSVNTNNPQTVRYQYRLGGLDKNWRAITNRSEASYGNLSPGTYTFQVRSMNEVGHWSRHTNYTFTIRPPWWQTWWAYGLYTLLFVGMIYGIIQYRVAQGLEKIRATESIRVRISSDLHDDVGSILSGLAMQSQMIALTAPENQKEPLKEISDMSHEAMDRMRDTVWAIDSRKDKYENLIDRMRAFAEKNLNLKQITHDFEVTVDDARRFINPQKRQNIYLIFKEAISQYLQTFRCHPRKHPLQAGQKRAVPAHPRQRLQSAQDGELRRTWPQKHAYESGADERHPGSSLPGWLHR